MITVFGRATSSNVQSVMWGIGELGLVHDRLDRPDFTALTPHRLVPVIRDGDLVVWESSAILRYLASRYGAAPFWPEDPAERAPVDMWAEWGKTTLGRDFTRPIFWARVRTPATDRDEAALAAALTRFEADLDILEDRLGDGPWLLGPDFTLADIVVGHLLFRYFTIDIPRPDRPELAAYYERLTVRPAFAEHVMDSWAPLLAEGA